MDGRDEKGKSVGRRLLSKMRTVLRRPESSKPSGLSSPLPKAPVPTAASQAQTNARRTVPVAVNPSRYGAQNNGLPT